MVCGNGTGIPNAEGGKTYTKTKTWSFYYIPAEPLGAVRFTLHWRSGGPGSILRSGISFRGKKFFLPLIQEGQLSVAGGKTGAEYWLTA